MRKHWFCAVLCLLLCLGCAMAYADPNFQMEESKVTVMEGGVVQLTVLRQGPALEGEISWTSSNQRVASVDADGLVTGRAKGNVTITARAQSGNKTFTATASVSVLRAATGITVNESKLDVTTPDDPRVEGLLLMENDLPLLILTSEQAVQISAKIAPQDASDAKYTVTVDDPTLFRERSDTNTTLTPQKAGETVLTVASRSNPEVQKQYHVLIIQPVKKIEIQLNRSSIGVGGILQASALISPLDATFTGVVWSSLTPKVVSVDARGIVTGLARGDGRIRATAVDGSKRTAEAVIKVTQQPTEITVDEKNLTVLEPTDARLEGLLWLESDLPVLMLTAGQSVTLQATVAPSNATDKKFNVTVDDESLFKSVRGATLVPEQPGETLLTVAANGNPDIMKQYHVLVVRGVQKIGVSFDRTTIHIGETARATASISPADATWPQVTWSTLTPKIVSVDAYGNVTGLARGEGRIRATAADGSNVTGTASVQVHQQPTGITLSGQNSVLTGSSTTLKATVAPSNANEKTVTWRSSDSRVATVSAGGRVTGIKAGQCTIVCTSTADPAVFASWEITVVQRVTSISFTTPELTLNVGEDARVFWNVGPADATDPSVTLTSSSTKVATVDQLGNIHAVKRGECTITAKANDGSGKSARIKVKVLQPVWGVHMRNDLYTVDVGESVTIQAVLEPSDASNNHMTWSSANPNIATVKGKTNRPSVYGHTWGTTTLTGVTEDGGFVTQCSVKVGTFNKALQILDLEIDDSNQIRISVHNQSNMNITRFYFTVACYDEYDNPLSCRTDGSNTFSGHYLETLYAGMITRHGRFHFADFVQPAVQIGRVVFTITGYQCDDGFSYTYPTDRRPWRETTCGTWLPPQPEDPLPEEPESTGSEENP